MDHDKRNLSKILRQYNTQLKAYCSPEHEARDEAFRYLLKIIVNE